MARLVEIPSMELIGGHTKSCGCLKLDILQERNHKHGLTGVPEYSVWQAMKSRCYNPNNISYQHYGGRGIKIQESWRDNFEEFYNYLKETIGLRPGTGDEYDIDRIENDGDYCEGNIRWATKAQNNRNKRNNKLIPYCGETKCLTDWAKQLGIDRKTLANRLNKGWTIEEAFTTPPGQQRN